MILLHYSCYNTGEGREASHKVCTLNYLICLKYPEQTANQRLPYMQYLVHPYTFTLSVPRFCIGSHSDIWNNVLSQVPPLKLPLEAETFYVAQHRGCLLNGAEKSLGESQCVKMFLPSFSQISLVCDFDSSSEYWSSLWLGTRAEVNFIFRYFLGS